MLFWTIIILNLAILVSINFLFLKKKEVLYSGKKKELNDVFRAAEKEDKSLTEKVDGLEGNLSERFLFYETARKLAPILNEKELFDSFSEELRYLGQIDEMSFSDDLGKGDYLRFELDKENKKYLYIKTKSKAVIGYSIYFVNLLKLCLERINLYARLQHLSINDSLTKTYNRRYFMSRYLEEFERAKKFNFNLSFLMIDIDYFKNINDTYGHLVGDAVLREVASLIKENTRQIDLVARYGGDEFSVILPEVDKAGAIMVAERISSRISRERIKAFDESLDMNVSVGVANFPQNTLYSDVLMETADKALYKAKLSGRNRVSWF